VRTRREVGEAQTVEVSGSKRLTGHGRTQDTVESVFGKGGPRPSVAEARGRYTLPHNNPFQPEGGLSEETTRT